MPKVILGVVVRTNGQAKDLGGFTVERRHPDGIPIAGIPNKHKPALHGSRAATLVRSKCTDIASDVGRCARDFEGVEIHCKSRGACR